LEHGKIRRLRPDMTDLKEGWLSTMLQCLGAVVSLLAALALASGVADAADIEAGRRKAEVCAACHGRDGNATIPGTPSLAAQPVFFTHWQLIKYKDGRRKDTQMTPLVQNLSDTDMADLAAYYQAQPARRRPATTDPAMVTEGKRLADLHHCTSCHTPGLIGQEQAARLAGQDFDYLLRLLRGFKAKTASDLDGTMTTATQPLTDTEIVSLVHYISTLGPDP
ncbi:MAG: c-type cytochrome, partial [Thermoanaerobaculia bacterium]